MSRALLLAGIALALAAPAAAQLGAAPSSPAPEGVEQGQGAAHPKGQYHALDALPDWGGIWFLQRGAPGGPPPPRPELRGDYLAAYEAWRQAVADNQGVVPRNRSNCSPPGLPGIMQLAQYPYEFLFTPGRVTINQEAWMQTRTIWTDGRAHEEDPDPSFHGDAVGHWEGDTLVVETIGISDELELGPGMPHSDRFRLVERIHLSPDDPDVLVNRMTYHDPEALAEPFSTTVTYRRDRHGSLIEFQCSENDRNPVNAEGETLFE